MVRIGGRLALAASFFISACAGTGSGDPAPTPAGARGTVGAGEVSVDRSHYESVIDMIRGKAPGLQIIETPTGTIEVRIRGLTQSLREEEQEPLVVIDGVPSSRPAGQTLLSLDPQQVASIEILRDVSSTAVYGTRGANGVILVRTTRR